jgi:hypothetical protein
VLPRRRNDQPAQMAVPKRFVVIALFFYLNQIEETVRELRTVSVAVFRQMRGAWLKPQARHHF